MVRSHPLEQGGIAQLVERRSCKPEVGSSTLPSSTMKVKGFTTELYFTGKTTDGKWTVAGETIFKLYDEEGIPLWSVFTACALNNCVPDWISFYEYAITKGNWTFDKIMKVFKYEVPDAFGKEFGEEVLKRMHFYIYAWGKYNYRHPLDNPKTVP